MHNGTFCSHTKFFAVCYGLLGVSASGLTSGEAAHPTPRNSLQTFAKKFLMALAKRKPNHGLAANCVNTESSIGSAIINNTGGELKLFFEDISYLI